MTETFEVYLLLTVSKASPVGGKKPVRTADMLFKSGVTLSCAGTLDLADMFKPRRCRLLVSLSI